MVDRWFGRFMDKYDQMGLGEDTAVLLLSDHGVPLGEHGIFKKIPPALYPELLDAPLMLRMPGASPENKRVKGIVHECDIAPTILKQMGLDLPETMTGLDFWPLVTGEKDEIRDYAVGGYHTHAYVRDRRYHYFRSLKGDNETFLFDQEKDPEMRNNIATEEPGVAKMMEERLLKELDGWTLPDTIGKSAAHMPYVPPRLRTKDS